MEHLASQLDTKPVKTEVIEIDTRPDEAVIISSVCPNCEKTGETRMLLTEIPFFKDIVVMSFSCPHCGHRNNEIQPAGALEDYGCKIELCVQKKEDLERDIVRSNHAVIKIPELQLEIPSSGKGYLSTLEGFMDSFREDLEINQDYRREHCPDVALQIDDFLRKLKKYIDCDDEILPYTFQIDDPSGHSNIKNLVAPHADPQLTIEKYVRTVEQITAMGYSPETADANATAEEPKALDSNGQTPAKDFNMTKQSAPSMAETNLPAPQKHLYSKKETEDLIGKLEKMNIDQKEKEIYRKYEEREQEYLDAHGMNFKNPLQDNIDMKKENQEESISFPTTCHNCFAEGVTRMCTCEIPFFKEIIVMAFTCEKCGARSSEVKTGGGISALGKKSTLYVDSVADMNRDVFKSETCEVTINELGLTITTGSLGSLYSTVEGLFMKMIENLRDNNPFVGDSSDTEFKGKFSSFIDKLEKYQDGKEKFTLIFDDPLGNSWIMNPHHPEKDPKLVEVEYQRTKEQDIELGINYLIEAEEEEKRRQKEQIADEKKEAVDNKEID